MSRLSIRYLATAALLLSPLAWGHDHGFSISTNFDKGVISCDQLEVAHPANVARAQQQYTVPANALLKINAAQNGGVAVEGWDKNEYSVTACKLATGNDAGDAQRILSQIHVTQSGGQFNFSGPASSDDEKDWMVYVLVRAPRNADLDIETYNGPLFFKSIEGRIKGRARNGPIALKNSTGNIDIEAQNGPVAVEGSGGTVQARTRNGPLAVSLTGTRWEGGGLNASTVNGPVALRLPNNYVSGVELEASNHSPFACKGAVCTNAQRTWDEGHRRLTFGAGAPVIRMSTVNGPVAVNTRLAEN